MSSQPTIQTLNRSTIPRAPHSAASHDQQKLRRSNIPQPHQHEHGHIPPPDPPRRKRILGIQTHHLFGGLFLIAILLLYLLLLVRHDVWRAFHR